MIYYQWIFDLYTYFIYLYICNHIKVSQAKRGCELGIHICGWNTCCAYIRKGVLSIECKESRMLWCTSLLPVHLRTEMGIPEVSRSDNPAYTVVEKSLPQTRWAGRLSSDVHTLTCGMYAPILIHEHVPTQWTHTHTLYTYIVYSHKLQKGSV